MGPVSTRTCVPNLVAVRRSCRKKRGGTDRQTGRQADRQTKISAALYSIFLYADDTTLSSTINSFNNEQSNVDTHTLINDELSL